MSVGKELFFCQANHTSSSRDYFARMAPSKPAEMRIAKDYDFDYWDGDRRFGYGGYGYIPGRQTKLASDIISYFELSEDSKILDVGCGKGVLLHELSKIFPDQLNIGVDISRYAIEKSVDSSLDLRLGNAVDLSQFEDNEFDLAISLATFHNLEMPELERALKEFGRVSRRQYLMVESYRNEEELTNLQCWALTAESFFSKREWIWLYRQFDYAGDYEFIYFE